MFLAILRAADQPPPQPAARELLNDVMSDTSQAIAFAGWLTDLEFLLWELLDSGTLPDHLDPWGFRSLNADDLADLRWLVNLAGGWWYYAEPAGDEVFVETSAWRELHAAWLRGSPR